MSYWLFCMDVCSNHYLTRVCRIGEQVQRRIEADPVRPSFPLTLTSTVLSVPVTTTPSRKHPAAGTVHIQVELYERHHHNWIHILACITRIALSLYFCAL